MSREESLGKRLLDYLGLNYKTVRSNGFIQIDFSNTGSIAVPVLYNNWHNVLYGNPEYCFENICEYIIVNLNLGFRFKTRNKPFRFESLEELEMQLSVRGF